MKDKKADFGKAKKPEMYGLSKQYGKKTIAMAVIGATIGGILMKIFFVERRKLAYKKFYE